MELYERDFHAWCLEQAELLKQGRLSELDVEHLIEEVDGLAGRDRRELKSHLRKLLAHMLKFWVRPEMLRRHHSWRKSITEARLEIESILEQSPGIFQGKQAEVIDQCYERALRWACEDMRVPKNRFPPGCPWSWDQIMTDGFFGR